MVNVGYLISFYGVMVQCIITDLCRSHRHSAGIFNLNYLSNEEKKERKQDLQTKF
jgi:hypothetical protein